MKPFTPAAPPLPPPPPLLARGPGEPAAALVDAHRAYGKGDGTVLALDGVTVAFECRRFTAIMGPSGSGKSTLLHCAAGLDRLSAGRVFLGGVELGGLGENQLTRLRGERIGVIFQSFNLVGTLTAAENMTLPLELAGRRVDRAWFDQVVSVVGLESRLKHRPAQLSGGQQQRVAVARALLGRPEVIFADEPTGNLDSRSSDEVLRFLKAMTSDLGQTVVMVTHDPVAAARADRVVVLADGRLAGDIWSPTAADITRVLTGLARPTETTR